MGAINERLVKRGHRVTVLTTDAADFELFWNRDRQRFSELEDSHKGVRILRFPVRHLPFPRYSFPAGRLATAQLAKIFPNSRLSQSLTTFFPHVPAMKQWLRSTNEKFDVVLGMPITLEGLQQVAQQFARKQNIPFIIFPLTHLGGGSAPGTEKISRFYTMPQQQQIVLSADGMVANNPAEKAFYAGRGMDERNIIVAPPAPDFDQLAGGEGARWRAEYRIPADRPVVAVVSALTEAKGTIHTLDAMQQLWRAGEKITLALAGNPMSDFEDYLAKLPAEAKQQLIVRGRISDEERNDLLAAADIFCMPSAVESFGLAFAEAMTYKKPVIGADVWGVKAFVIRHGENGYLVEPGDVSRLAEKIKRLVDDRPLAKKMGEDGYRFVMEELSWEKTVDQVEDFVVGLVGGYKN